MSRATHESVGPSTTIESHRWKRAQEARLLEALCLSTWRFSVSSTSSTEISFYFPSISLSLGRRVFVNEYV